MGVYFYMYVLNKKRIMIILSCVILSTLAFEIKKTKDMEIIETVALPANKKVIVIDAGHGGEDGGATTNTRSFGS